MCERSNQSSLLLCFPWNHSRMLKDRVNSQFHGPQIRILSLLQCEIKILLEVRKTLTLKLPSWALSTGQQRSRKVVEETQEDFVNILKGLHKLIWVGQWKRDSDWEAYLSPSHFISPIVIPQCRMRMRWNWTSQSLLSLNFYIVRIQDTEKRSVQICQENEENDRWL